MLIALSICFGRRAAIRDQLSIRTISPRLGNFKVAHRMNSTQYVRAAAPPW